MTIGNVCKVYTCRWRVLSACEEAHGASLLANRAMIFSTSDSNQARDLVSFFFGRVLLYLWSCSLPYIKRTYIYNSY